MSDPINASHVRHFIGDMLDFYKPVYVYVDGRCRTISKVRENGGHLVLDASPLPDDDKVFIHFAERPDLYECDACSGKVGSPTLCTSCQFRRSRAGKEWRGRQPKITYALALGYSCFAEDER